MTDKIYIEDLLSDTFECIVGLGGDSITGMTPEEVRALKRKGTEMARETLIGMPVEDVVKLAEDLLVFANVILLAPDIVRQHFELE